MQRISLLASAAMQRYARGDDRAFAELYQLIRPRLHSMCRKYIGPSDAEDLMQEVFIKNHRYRAAFAPSGNVLSWVATIVSTTCIDHLRRRECRPELSSDPRQLELRGATSRPITDVERFVRMLSQLRMSEKLLQTYWLVKYEGVSCAQTARLLGTSTEAVKQRVHRVREMLHAILRELEA
jgi:RNA polymerase sigma-70 factor (ECF subfamily)